MASRGYGPVIRQVGRLLGGSGTATGLDDGPLLRRFADHRDGAAFEALVARHGPMVLATSRRMLVDPRDVEDAFQATFLVLARKAGSIRDADRLGPWLHGVARRVASRSRALAARRDARERPGAEDRAITRPDPAEAVELRSALDEELARLPEKYRAPLVLCYLEGLTHDEAAMQLSWPVGTVRSRLAGGRDRLRSRLTRRGLSPSATVPAILPTPAIPEALMSATIRVATAAGSTPARVATLAKGVLIAMMWNKLKVIGAVGLMAGLTVGGVGTAAQLGGATKADSPIGAKLDDREPPKDQSQERQAALDAMTTKAEELQVQLRRLEQEIATLRAELEKARASNPAESPPRDEIKDAVPKPEAAEAEVPQPAASPSVTRLGGPYIMAIPAERDRATVFNANTGFRDTFRLPEGVTQVMPISGAGVVALYFKAPRIDQIAAFDIRDGKWYRQDLREPAKEISPMVGPQDVTCTVGRCIYVFSTEARKWSVLELKRDPGKAGIRGMGGLGGGMGGGGVTVGPNGAMFGGVGGLQNGKMIIPEGSLIHVYDVRTGEWTHIDTKEDK